MDVLDDLKGEAVEVCKMSPWLTYGMPLHRLREFGSQVKLFDFLDERKLHLAEVAELVSLILGGAAQDLPHPELDWPSFLAAVERLASQASAVFCPVRQKRVPWIDTKRLKRQHKKGGCHVM